MAESRVVSGTIGFTQVAPAAGSVVHVVVEEVTRADAAATVAARIDLPLHGPIAFGARLPFALSVFNVDVGKRYTVRVHVDHSGNGRVEPGDQISKQSYPVLTQGSPPDAAVDVSPV